MAAAAEEERRLITSEELCRHNTAFDLWISIQGKVYGVTEWTKEHPGGDLPLLNLAGQDVTDAFVAYHPGSAWRHLDRFLIGHLADYWVSEASKDYRRLVAEFTRQGLFERKDHGTFATLCLMFMLFSPAVYGVLYTRRTRVHFFSGGLTGFLWTQSGWISHDSGHYTVMRTPAPNKLAQFVFRNCLTGVSVAWWRRSHNAHHIACNNLDFDPDLQQMPMFAMSSEQFQPSRSNFDAVTRFLVSYQHWTFYPVMCLARIDLMAQFILLLLLSKKKVPNRGQELLGFAMFWLWNNLFILCLSREVFGLSFAPLHHLARCLVMLGGVDVCSCL